MKERIRVSGFPRPIVAPGPRLHVRPVALVRPANLIGLLGGAGMFAAVAVWGTPHMLLSYTYSGYGDYRFYTDCAYAGFDGHVLHLNGASCPIFRLLKPQGTLTMPRTDDPTLSVPNPSAEFRAANPEVFAKAQGDLDTTRRLGAVETRAEAIKQRFYAHFEKHEDAWVAAEALRLAEKRSYPTLQHPAPRMFGVQSQRGPDVAELMMTKARQNVHARGIRRLTAINSIKANLQNALVRNRPRIAQSPANDGQPQNHLKQGSPKT